MANTVTLLSYANTFGDWVVTTNKLAQENNDFAANNFVKPTGTLFLNSPTLGLQVANNVIVQGQLQVSGVGSSAYVQKNLQVDGSIIGGANNYFIASDSNTLFTITQSGTGLAIRINSQPGGSGQFGANSTVIDANGNVYIGSASAGTFKLNVANGNVNFSNNLTVGSNITSQIVRTTNHVVSKDITASANVLGDRIQANTNLISPTLSVSGVAFIDYVQGNTAVNTASLTVTNSTTTNTLQATSFIYSPTISGTVIVASANVIANTITANNNIFTNGITVNSGATINASGADLYIDDVVANTVSVQGNFTISGALVYNTDKLILNALAGSPLDGTFASARGTGNANAEIRWNESQDYWDIRDVNNPTSYSKILTANLISDSTSLASSDNLASSRAANYLQNVSNSQNTAIAAGNTYAWMTSWTANSAWSSANAGVSLATAAYGAANTAAANTIAINTLATSAYGKANAEGTINTTQNTNIAAVNTFSWMASYTANAAWIGANTANGNISALQAQMTTTNTNITAVNTLATAAYGKANAEGTINNTQNTWITNTNTFAAAAFAKANTGVTSVGGTSPISSTGGSTPTISLDSAYGDTQNPYGSKTAKFFLAAPNSSSGAPSFRAIVASDIPTLNQNTTGTASNITTYTIDQNLGTSNDVQFDSLGVGVAATGVSGEIVATENITAYYSDERLKNKLGNIENALDKVMSLSGFYYEANDVAQNLGYSVKREVGVSAQEVQKVLPEIIAPAPIDNNYLTVRYEKLIPLLIEAIKDLKSEIDSLKGDNK